MLYFLDIIVTYASGQQGDRSDEKSLNALDEAKKKLNNGAATVSQSIFSCLDSTTLATYFSEKTKELISTESFKYAGKGVKYVDIVRDVINLIPVHYVSQELVRLVDFLFYVFLLIYYTGWTSVKN